MPRYIDIDAVDCEFKESKSLYASGWNSAVQSIKENAPTAPVESVVHCSECKHAHLKCQECDILDDVVITPEFWCAYGERKDGGEG